MDSNMTIDLRSDTVTRPSSEMLNYMMAANVGDDVFGEDENVNELEATLANAFQMEAGLFCPSGTLANQIAIKCHTQPGDEVICDKTAHVYIYEGGGIASNSGAQVRPIDGIRGIINAEQIDEFVNPDDVHRPKSRLVCLENTSNRGGGACYSWENMLEIKDLCDDKGLKLHLDGARLFNAIVAKNEEPAQYGKIFDSISICLSKGLGAPVGSVLLGSSDYIAKARRVRKVFGGGMRQAGYLAAAGLFALKNNIGRLDEDHQNARIITNALLEKSFVGKILPVETNIIIFEVLEEFTALSFCELLASFGILCLPINKSQVRMVTHLDVCKEKTKKVVGLINSL